MRSLLSLLLLVSCCVCVRSELRIPPTSRELTGCFFSVSETKKIIFSPGNLQYNAALGSHVCADGSTQPGTWRFAEHQYDYVGDGTHGNVYYDGEKCDNKKIAEDYDGWIDLFGWGTSGWNIGANQYLPWATSEDNTDYFPGGSSENCLTGDYAYADWGVYNDIINGTDTDPAGTWRTLTKDEQVYLFRERADAENLFGLGTVNEVNGLIILPDNWVQPSDAPVFVPSTSRGLHWNKTQFANDAKDNFSHNTYTSTQWRVMEQRGAVFLPCTGLRKGTNIERCGIGFYWASTRHDTELANGLYIGSRYFVITGGDFQLRGGRSVRLVKDVTPPPSAYKSQPFSVSSDRQITFSSGNLQYNAALGSHQCADGTMQQGTWRFAEHQWDYVGNGTNGNVYLNGDKCDNSKIAEDYDGWIDLFGWGTSGWNSGANAYQPWSTTMTYSDYSPGNDMTNSLTGAYAQADWGIYNEIKNGSQTDPAGTWRTLTFDEWLYIFHGRKDYDKLFGFGHIEGDSGLIILPDNWQLPQGLSFYPGVAKGLSWSTTGYNQTGSNHYQDNSYTHSQWAVMEAAGAVFLPCGNFRYGTSVNQAAEGTGGYYWASYIQDGTNDVYRIYFTKSYLRMQTYFRRDGGRSVRLVRDYHTEPKIVELYDTVCYSPSVSYGGYEIALPLKESLNNNGYADYDFEYSDTGNNTIYHLHLAALLPIPETVLPEKHICGNESYTWLDGKDYSTSQILTYTDMSRQTGCDSVITQTLTVLPPSEQGRESMTIYDNQLPFSWHGMVCEQAGDYIDSTLTTTFGCDSTVTLHLTVESVSIDSCSVIIDNSCADDKEIVMQLTYDRKPDYLHISFSGRNNAAGLPDTLIYNVSNYIIIPHNAKPGHYKADVQLYVGNTLANTASAGFDILYPASVLEQRWDDFIGVLTGDYNGGYDFVSFQWYKNNRILTGEDNSYLYQPLETGAAYSAMLEEQDGTQLMTCEIIATSYTEASLYPTLASPNQVINLHIEEQATVIVYNPSGQIVSRQKLSSGGSSIKAPENTGIYMVSIILHNNDKAKTYKLIVR